MQMKSSGYSVTNPTIHGGPSVGPTTSTSQPAHAPAPPTYLHGTLPNSLLHYSPTAPTISLPDTLLCTRPLAASVTVPLPLPSVQSPTHSRTHRRPQDALKMEIVLELLGIDANQDLARPHARKVERPAVRDAANLAT